MLFSLGYIFRVKQEMDTSTISFPMKTRHAATPSLSNGGKLLFGVKANFLRCIESNSLDNKSIPEADAVILDGAAMVQILNLNSSRTFQEYSEIVFTPYISAELNVSFRVDQD